jgi:hypothetical protein
MSEPAMITGEAVMLLEFMWRAVLVGIPLGFALLADRYWRS